MDVGGINITDYKTMWDTISSNPLAMSLIIMPILSGIVYFGRNIPITIWTFLWGITTTEVVVYELNSRDAYNAIEYMLDKYKFKCIVSNMIFHKVRYSDKPVLSAGIWTIFYGFVKGCFITVRRTRDSENKMETGFIFYIRFFSRNKIKIRKLLTTIADEMNNIRLDGTYRLNTVDRWNSDWQTRIKRNIPLSTCTNQQRQVITKIKEITQVEDFTKFGALLYGCPGGGKSKLIEALTSELGMRMYYFNLSQMDDKEFMSVLGLVSSPAIMLFEDIDCVSGTTERKEDQETKTNEPAKIVTKPTVSLATLLNVFDGVLSLDRQIIIATTNHPDKLDKALKRKGRFDMSIELLPIEHDEICKIASRYFNTGIINTDKMYGKRFSALSVANVYTACKLSSSVEEFCEVIFNETADLQEYEN